MNNPWGLHERDWLRVAGYFALGLVAQATCFCGGLLTMYTLWFPLSKIRPDGLQSVVVSALSCLLGWGGLLVSAWAIRARSPREGRLRWARLVVLAFGVALAVTCGAGAVAWVSENLVGHAVDLFAASIFIGIPLAWNLTWSLDAVRRRRRALDAAGKT